MANKWTGVSQLGHDNPFRLRIERFQRETKWDRLLEWIFEVHRPCKLSSDFSAGGNHLVQKIICDDGTECIARLRMPSSDQESDIATIRSEVDCLRLVIDQSTVPVPKVLGHCLDAARFGAPVMLMECLPGTVAMDLNFDHIPAAHKDAFFEEMASIQVRITSIKLPKIGSVLRRDDGTYTVGPIPGIGGPFESSTRFFKAWAATAKFPHSNQRTKELCGEYADEIMKSVAQFPDDIRTWADSLTSNGEFYLRHPDFGHNNIVVDVDDYEILGVIDWEGAYSVPAECLDFPLLLRVVPRAMDSPSSYSEDGHRKDDATRATLADRQTYLEYVTKAEGQHGLPNVLSNALADPKGQDICAAISLYAAGKMGLNSRLLKVSG